MTCLAVPTHSSLKQESAKTDVRAMAPSKEEAFGREEAIEHTASCTWGNFDDSSRLVEVDMLVLAKIKENGIVSDTPRSPGMATRSNREPAILFLGETDRLGDMRLFRGFHDSDRVPVGPAMVENPPDPGLLVGVGVTAVFPRD